MRRWGIGLAALVVAVSGLAASWTSHAEPAFSDAATKRSRPVYGIVGEWLDTKLARLDPRSLRPLRGPTLEMLDSVDGWAFSPDRSRLALGTACQAGLSLGTLRLVDLRRVREVGCFGIGPIAAAAWVQTNRLLVITHSPLRALVIDPSAGRIVRQTPIEGAGPAEIARAGDRLVVLVKHILPEPDRLVVADVGGSVRSVDIRVRGASDLVVNAGARQAYVVSTGAVAEVDLDTLAVADHELQEHVSARGRRLAALGPTARAKEVSRAFRQALWVGGGQIAFTGSDTTFEGRRISSRPVGLKLIDTRTWTVRTVNDQVSNAVLAGAVLLTKGGREGLAAYDARGVKRYELFGGRNVAVMEAYGGKAYLYVYVASKPVPKVIDVRTGRVLTGSAPHSLAGRQPPLNLLLVERARWRTP